MINKLVGSRIWIIGRTMIDSLPIAPESKVKIKSNIRYYLERIFGLMTNIVPGGSYKLLERIERQRISPCSTNERIEVSIVIPVYNEIGYTLKCLSSIEKYTIGSVFEVIVVDDCSQDATSEELRHRKNIKYLRNDTNLGFIRSCNRGAKAAQGDYIVMLNNDTEVTVNWLIELLDTFYLKPDTGLVGAKLVYPDGTLQEAGGIIWQDGTAWNYGRGDDPNRPEYNYLREADYISGACIMLRKALWDDLGGFDEHYIPAYGEDSDLSFKVKKKGFNVYYQPMSTVIHHEGISCGKEVSSGTKSYQLANAIKLFERWKDDMQSYRKLGEKPEYEKERDIKRRILVIDAVTPTPDQDAGSITSTGIMNACQALGYKVTFIPESNFSWIPGYSEALSRIGIESITYPFYKNVKDFLKKRGSEFDAVLIFRGGIAAQHIEIVRKYAPQAKMIYHASDLHFLREERSAELQKSERVNNNAHQIREMELNVVSSTDCTIVHSTEEQSLLKELVKGSTIVLFPWILDVVDDVASFSERKDILFLGGYRHPPNVDAVEYFVEDVWPLIKERLPDAKFIIVGSNAPAKFKKLNSERVIFRGFVQNIDDLMTSSRLSIVPLRYGAGIKGKIGTAMSYGIPSVTTSIGSEGMMLENEREVLIADSAEQFADSVVRLYTDVALWDRLSHASIDYVKNMYSKEKGVQIMKEVLSA